jgi:hypothetical protein
VLTFSQGGNLIYGADQIDAVVAAAAKFNAETTDPKAALNLLFLWTPAGGLTALAGVFYNAPEPPAGVFDEFLALPYVAGAAVTQSLRSLATSTAFPESPRFVSYNHNDSDIG